MRLIVKTSTAATHTHTRVLDTCSMRCTAAAVVSESFSETTSCTPRTLHSVPRIAFATAVCSYRAYAAVLYLSMRESAWRYSRSCDLEGGYIMVPAVQTRELVASLSSPLRCPAGAMPQGPSSAAAAAASRAGGPLQRPQHEPRHSWCEACRGVCSSPVARIVLLCRHWHCCCSLLACESRYQVDDNLWVMMRCSRRRSIVVREKLKINESK